MSMVRKTSKRRFGVSIPSSMAEKLDLLSEMFRCDRSTLVSNALNEYVHENLHEREEHECEGVVVAYSQTPLSSKLITDFNSIIVAYCSYKLKERYIHVLVVKGSSRLIRELRSILAANTRIQRYLPLDYFEEA
ncbi:MAG: ribbon-helix-helix domain-containing protein [Desulfurococcus sp.]|nr:ribbon-helix-helix domain-containing protein [Desulfurococcus sp.]